MTVHSISPATFALQVHYPKLVLLVLAFAARLLLTGCAATPTALHTTPVTQAPQSQAQRVSVGSNEAPSESDAAATLRSSLDKRYEAVTEDQAGPTQTDSDPSHHFIPGC